MGWLSAGRAIRGLHGLLVSLKFGLAAGLAMAAGLRWTPEDVISVVFIALLCTRPSMTGALRDAREQVLASLVGTAVVVGVVAGLGQSPGTLAIAGALAWGLAAWLRWNANGTVIILFSVAYLGQPLVGPSVGLALQDRVWLREASLLLGVMVALGLNVVASPFMARANMAVRLAGGVCEVRALLAGLAAAIASGDRRGLEASLASFDAAFGALGGIRAELVDLSRDMAFLPAFLRLPGWSVAAARDLEAVVHHVQDAAGATRALLVLPQADREPTDPLLLRTAVEGLQAGVAALDAADVGRYAEAAALARQEGQRLKALDMRLAAPQDLDARLGPRLWVLVALAAAFTHLERLMCGLQEAGSPGSRSA